MKECIYCGIMKEGKHADTCRLNKQERGTETKKNDISDDFLNNFWNIFNSNKE